MDPSRLIASISVALDKLRYRREQSISRSDEMKLEIMMRGLRVVRTFLLCSTKLTEDNNDSLCSQKLMVMEQSYSGMKKDLKSLLVRVEAVVRRITDDLIPYEPYDFRYDMESCEEEMDNWYTSLSDYLKKYSTSPVPNQIKVITDSVLQSLKDYLISKESDVLKSKEQLQQKQQIVALKKNITVMRNIIGFGTLLCTESQEFLCLLTQIEPLAISAAHFTLHLFSNIKGPMHLPNDVTSSMLSALLLKINHVIYTLPLASLKHSLELCHPIIDLNDYPLIIQMEHCIVFLLSTLWEMPQLASRVFLKDLQLYERLRLLRTLLKKQPDRFDDDKIRYLSGAAVFDAGIRILSLCQKDTIDHGLQCFQDNSEVIWAEVLEEKVVETSNFKFSKTNVLGFLDFLLEDYLMEVNSSNVDSNTLSCVPKIRKYLVFLKSFMGKLVELRNHQENIHQDVWNISVGVAYKIEYLIDQLVLGDILDSFSMSLQSITQDMMTVEADSLNIFNDQGRQEIFKVQQITPISTDKVRSARCIPEADEVVGFESEKASIVNRLMTGFKKLQVVAVIGMPGLGKTTLATKVYSAPSISYYFHVKVWCSISQVFDRRKVLIELLNQIKPDESLFTMSEDDLSQQLWRSLRKRKYLIVVDDVWDTEAFNLLRESLPDDSNQSRILLTSRLGDVVPEALLDMPLFLRNLTVDESLELLQKKLFPGQKEWPSALHELGMEIAECCKGLPLTVVIIAGLLKTTELEVWNDVLKALRSSTISELTDQCKSTIELSYKHLPDYLKPCFLWFGAFPEDHEVSVKKLIWIWIAEGIVRKSESKSLEDVAADYLKELIGRSLVMNVKERSIGGVKACRIHDLLHEFCLRKANEDFFLHSLKVDDSGEQEQISDDEYDTLSIDETELRNLRRLCIYSNKPEHFKKQKWFCPSLRSLLFFFPKTDLDEKLDRPFMFHMFKLLRVLGMDEVQLTGFPSEIGALVQLRYLAIQVDGFVSPAIGNLSNLETLILKVRGVVSLPDTFWKLKKLRHLYSKHGWIELPINSSEDLLELKTLSGLNISDWSVVEKQLRKFPNIRRIKCKLCDENDSFVNDSKLVDFSFLSQLESLSFTDFRNGTELSEVIFPEKIKKLTLWETKFPWNKISSIAKLPYLEVLKLLENSFLGDSWHVEEGGFAKLKCLKLRLVELVKWTAASDDLFSNLEKLVLRKCYELEEIPECLKNVATLETIEVTDCPYDVVILVEKVVKCQKELGNSDLQFHEDGTWQRLSYEEKYSGEFIWIASANATMFKCQDPGIRSSAVGFYRFW